MSAKQTLRRFERRVILATTFCLAAGCMALAQAQEAPVNPINGKPFAEIKQLPDGAGGVVSRHVRDRRVRSSLRFVRNIRVFGGALRFNRRNRRRGLWRYRRTDHAAVRTSVRSAARLAGSR